MLGLLLIYFIGKKFYTLAEDYDKSMWGYAILGVAIYYAGILSFGVLLGLFMVVLESDFLDTGNELLLSIISIPIGLLSCYILYVILEKKWKKEQPALGGNLIDEIGRKDDEVNF
ncbi:hypothetical protein [Tenacibaculum sp. M341]|uniref:hypothetical protein n=1 Tax=Tenacibaculum sp. M341 TaxID=2530339 RepID=UPI0010517D47|nr:hypothetical protein [Tenacibaculum sp. M341]TCI92664.1 hypothetical protein EYW44_07125 [Tenacibaculum sp. M341]